MSVTLRPVKWWLLASLFLVEACAADTSVLVQLVGLGHEDPYAGVVNLEITASINERIISRERAAFDGQPVALEPLEPKDNMELRAIGYDQANEIISRGLARPELPDKDHPCCVLMCFCTVAVFDAGDCSCGSDACVAECFE